MRLEPFCSMDLHYVDDFHLATPYDGDSGLGWGVGAGTVSGGLSGSATWSNQPTRRGDGSMLPDARGVIALGDGDEVFFDLTGRTVFVDGPDGAVGRQLLMCLFETGAAAHRWLNNTVCVAEGVIDPARMTMHLDVARCVVEPA